MPQPQMQDAWHDRLGGGTQADSIMDRLIHNAYEIPTNETNLRKRYDMCKKTGKSNVIEKAEQVMSGVTNLERSCTNQKIIELVETYCM